MLLDKRKKVVIKIDAKNRNKVPQIIAWLQRNGFNTDCVLQPDDMYIVCLYPLFHFEKGAVKIHESCIFSIARFMRDFVYVVKRCPISAHEIFEDALATLANFDIETFKVWFSTLSSDDQLVVWTEFEKHTQDIAAYCK